MTEPADNAEAAGRDDHDEMRFRRVRNSSIEP